MADPTQYYEGRNVYIYPSPKVDDHIHDDRGLTVGNINIGGASKKIIDKALGPNPQEKKEVEKELPVHLL